jgi:putative membrane protein
MYSQKQTSREAPGVFTYMELFSSRLWAYSVFISAPLIISLLSTVFNVFFLGVWDFPGSIIYLIEIFALFMLISGISALFTFLFFSNKAPILGPPPKGWGLQMNSFFTAVIGVSFLIGQVLTIFFRNIAFQELFFILGTIVAYIMAYTIYFSFTTLTWKGFLTLALVQPVVGIILYSFWTAQLTIQSFVMLVTLGSFDALGFFIKAIIFFCTCAFIFALPYARKFFQVSNIYKETTGIGGYAFIRAFVLSMLMDGEDEKIEEYFKRVGIGSDVKIQYLLIRSEKEKKIKGLIFIPHIHFGPFKTCGSSDLPEHIYKAFSEVSGTTVYHTTNTHAKNLTSEEEVEKVLNQIKNDIKEITQDKSLRWDSEVVDFSRKISNSAKLIGMVVNQTPLIFLTRHPLPSDDIQSEVGEDIRVIARKEGFKDIIVIDSHNSIIGDEILIERNTIEAKDLINVSEKFIKNNTPEKVDKTTLLYGVAKDPLNEFSENDGIGYGGIVVHIFKNITNDQKTVLIHFDGNNAFLEIRSFILNMLQNRGIEKGEVTTSDSHTVARQFSSRGYSPIGDKIKIEFLLQRLDSLVKEAENNLEPVEFYYSETLLKDIKIWGNYRYFDTIMNTLQECIKVSQRLLTFSLIVPSFFSLMLLLFYYNIQLFTP